MNTQGFLKIALMFNRSYFLLFVFTLSVTFSSVFAQQKPFTIVLDAGHGGKDPGRPTKNGYKESDIALKLVLALGKKLEKENGIKVVYTRKTDVFVDLFKRGKIANKANADLFISIHCNAHFSQAYGAETYVLGIHRNQTNFNVAKAENSVILLEENNKENYKGFDPNAPESLIGLTLMQEEYLEQSIAFASMVQQNLTQKLKRKDRGVKQAGFIVLHQTYMPSVLIESGFITNKKEGAFLNSKTGQEKIAQTIYEAIKTYKSNIDKNAVKEDDTKVADTVISTSEKNQETSNIYKGITFKVQIAAGRRKIQPKAYNFKGLKGVERSKVGRTYKYYLGSTDDFSKVKELQQKAKNTGFSTAFIVAFKNKKKVDLKKVLKNQLQ